MSESIHPRRTNANTDPTKILREYGQKRRTYTQIAFDNAQEAATIAKKAEKNRLEPERKVQEVSKFEDKLIDIDYYEDDGLENPAASMMGSQLPSMNNGYYAQHTQSDSDTLSDSHVIPMKAVRKIKAKQGALRSEINQAREEPLKAGAAPLRTTTHGGGSPQKRKQPEPADTKSVASMSKRPKTSEPSGLISNWKKLIPGDAVRKQLSNKTSKSEKGTHDDADECVRGELDEDEPDETILAVRSMKGSAPAIKIRHAGNSQVNVHVVKIEGDNTEEAGNRGNHRTKRVKYTVTSLPFPGGAEGSAYFKKYRKTFKPTLIAWASTLDDPFGANSLIEPTIRELWALIFPKINLDPNDKKWRPIDSIASEALTSWRSDLGKEALKIVRRFLLANIPKDDIPSFIDQMRNGPPKFQFIYGDPQQKASYTFRNELISPILAAHLKKTVGAIKDYGHPTGALGLCTASIERALEIWKDGEPPEPGESDEKNKATNGFTEAAWGFKARVWIASAKKLSDDKWESIVADAHRIMKAGGAKVTGEVIEVDDEDEEHDP
ncbi:hypothetical protein BD779DRAFT_1679258 [Infundibulicybe gibba]|nr:hypothetical protein BD779DRAFT_1679258 [Infundibulicybe gibba]